MVTCVIGSADATENAEAFAQADLAIALKPLPVWRYGCVLPFRRMAAGVSARRRGPRMHFTPPYVLQGIRYRACPTESAPWS